MAGTGIVAQLRQAIRAAEARGVTRYAIAQAAGIEYTVLMRVADGVTTPRVDTAEVIAAALGLRLTLSA